MDEQWWVFSDVDFPVSDPSATWNCYRSGWRYQALPNNPPLKEKSDFRKGGFSLVHFSILENLPGFYSFQNPRTKFGRAFIYTKKIGRFAAGFIFGVFFIRKSPLITPFPKIFSRASRAGFYLFQKISRASRAGFYSFQFSPNFRAGFYSFNFRFSKSHPGLAGFY